MRSQCYITVCGHYAGASKQADGQTIKTQTTVKALIDAYGYDNVAICDTYRWKRNPLKILLTCLNSARKSSDIVILPASNGIYIFIPLYFILGKFFKIRLHYSVIGGWLYTHLIRKRILVSCLKSFTTIQVETKIMKRDIESLGLKNVFIVPNYKTISPLTIDKLNKTKSNDTLTICTFSRIMKDKGIEDAVSVINELNKGNHSQKYTLDIYGAIDKNYSARFKEIMMRAPSEIRYRGIIDSDDSVNILKNYYLLIFPTHFKTEGLPGTVIDSFAAGLPVVSSRWYSFTDIITEGVTGYGYDIGNRAQLYKVLNKLRNQELVLPMRPRCLEAFKPYSYEIGSRNFIKCIEDTV